ncbi:AI-2E family transporter [Salinisphaera sp.]|uniref:AI-2E family transporter n=1 Tax=Salinisphaera sp. TaxID=1914330 RepID=UPI002D78C3EA|nr:AI-2E family transporter [Salinisphaera sp.]HET7314583.1 AI-2E family transporter [Salinisphaera sp.]
MSQASPGLGDFWRRCLIVSGITIGTVAVLWFIWTIGHAALLIFAAFLVAVALDALARALSRVSGLGRHTSVITVTVLLPLVLGVAVALGTMNVASQAPKLQHQIVQSINQLQDKLQQYQFTQNLLGSSTSSGDSGSGSGSSLGEHLASEISSAASVTLTMVTDLFLVLIIGIYLGLRPQIYYHGLLRLFPPDRQERMDFIAHEAADAVRRWLTGRAISMTLVGVGSVAGLWLIGIPFPLLLGLSAGLLTFIPYLGALVSAVPALLIAGLHGVWAMFYVGLLYLGLHIIEGYLMAPMIQRRAASIAPAFLLSVQVIGGTIAGVLGVALATPIALVIAVIIQLCYVQDVIGEKPHLPRDGPYE